MNFQKQQLNIFVTDYVRNTNVTNVHINKLENKTNIVRNKQITIPVQIFKALLF